MIGGRVSDTRRAAVVKNMHRLRALRLSQKLYDQIEAAEQKNDSNTTQALTKQADALVANLGPEYPKMIEGLEQVDLTSGEGKEFLSILSGLDKLCTK